MTPVTPSVPSTVSSVSTSTHIRANLTSGNAANGNQYYVVVIRVLHLMTLVCSIVLMFLSRWFVPSVRTPSKLKLGFQDSLWSCCPTPSQKVLTKDWVVSVSTPTVTTDVLQLRTSCDRGCCGSCPTCPFRPPSGGLFLCF